MTETITGILQTLRCLLINTDFSAVATIKAVMVFIDVLESWAQETFATMTMGDIIAIFLSFHRSFGPENRSSIP
jgi:hypothetical protein